LKNELIQKLNLAMVKRLFPQSFWLVTHLFLSYGCLDIWLVHHDWLIIYFDHLDWLHIYFHTHFWFATYLFRSSFEIGIHLFRPPWLSIHLLWPPWLPMQICCRFFLFGLCVVCSSSIYGLWLPLWYLLTLLTNNRSCWYKDDTEMECE